MRRDKPCKRHVAPLYHFETATLEYMRRCLICNAIVERISADMVDRMPEHLQSQLLRQAIERHKQAGV